MQRVSTAISESPVLTGRAASTSFLLAALLASGLAAYSLYDSPDMAGLLVGLACAGFIFASWYDLNYYLIPDALTYPGSILLLLAAALLPGASFEAALFRLLVGGGSHVFLNLISHGKVGLGDAKLAAFGGALVGVNYVLPALFLASLVALVPALTLIVLHRLSWRQALPYGPALSIGFIVVALAAGTTLSP